MAASGSIRIEYIYAIRITISSINFDVKYISAKFATFDTDLGRRLVSNFPRKMRKHYQQYPK